MASTVPTYPPPEPTNRGTNVSESVLISAVAILMFVVSVVLILHIYAHWHIRRARRRDARARRSRFVFHVSEFASEPASQGLDPAVLRSLIQFKRTADSDPIECAVCLSEVEEGESGRTLPKCSHSFHTGCIDMWFYSHSTCPLCRAVVELPPVEESEPEPGSASSGSSKGTRDFCVSVEIPTRTGNLNLDDESPAQVRSPVGRILSMILVRERRSTTSAPPSPTVGGCAAEVDLEDGLKGQGRLVD